MAMGRNIAAVIAGVIVGGGIIFLAEMVGASFYPLPAGVDMGDPEQARATVAARPAGAMVMVLLGWCLGALGGGALAARLARHAPDRHALVVGAILLALAVLNMVMLPHPLWMWPAAIVGVPASAWLGARLATRPAARADRGIA